MEFARPLSRTAALAGVLLASLSIGAPALSQEPAAGVPYEPDCTVEWRVTNQMMGLWLRAVSERNCELAGQPPQSGLCSGPLNPQIAEIGAYQQQLQAVMPEDASHHHEDFDTYVREADLLGEMEADAVFNERLNIEMQAQTPPPVLMQHYQENCPQEAPEE